MRFPNSFMPTLFAVLVVAIALACSSDKKSADGDVTFLPDGKQVSGDGSEEPVGPVVGCSVSEDCPFDLPVCDQYTKSCVECKKNEHCGGTKPFCNPAWMQCVECVMKDHCPSEYQFCLEGTCSDKPCFPNAAQCVGNTVHVCSADGMDPNYEVISCGDKVCHKGNCLECKPNEVSCKNDAVIKCHSDGKAYDALEVCQPPLQCLGAQCMYCYPGDKMCQGNIAMRCNIEGTAWEMAQDCSQGGLTCYMGACLSPCAGDIKQNTNAGCEFFAVDLDNYESFDNDAQHAQYAVIASNTSKDASADVTVTKPDGQTIAATIPPMSLHKFELPATWSVNDTMIGKNAFRISASQPIVVYQFNPLSNIVEVFSNDASVLLPAPSQGTEYYVMTYGFGGSTPMTEETPSSYFTVVGLSTVPTEVTFTVSAPTKGGGTIPALQKGGVHTVTLNQGEVLNVNSSTPGGDLTGTHIKANAPVAVFGGHECPFTADLCCCDHLEQQLIPVTNWGTHYIVSKSWERWKEQDYVRILASQDGTSVTLNPAIAQVPTLNAGQYYTFKTNVNLEITASKPILVAQILSSSYEILGTSKAMDCWSNSDCPSPFTCDTWSGNCVGPDCSNSNQCVNGTTCELDALGGYCAPIGDPALILAVSAQQFMDSYVFLTPDAYLRDYLNVIAPLDAQTVVLDNNQINPASFIPVGSSGYGVFRTAVGDGIHTIWSDKKIGIVVYGYDNDVSYGYPGGMGLLELDL
jgi:hypothetical protein